MARVPVTTDVHKKAILAAPFLTASFAPLTGLVARFLRVPAKAFSGGRGQLLDLRFYFCPSFSGVRCRLVPGSSGQKARDQIDFQMSFKGKLVSSQKMSAACNLCAIKNRC